MIPNLEALRAQADAMPADELRAAVVAAWMDAALARAHADDISKQYAAAREGIAALAKAVHVIAA